MKLQPQHIERLEQFLTKLRGDVYPEPPTNVHDHLTRQMVEHLWRKYAIAPGARVLDVGCGQGVGLEHFRQRNCEAIGITLDGEDLAACRAQGFDVREMDQSFLDFADEQFDLVWCRHCIEHSPFPLFTLHELTRVLKAAGVLYVEVPAPDTARNHQANPNHYSVLGKSMWLQLFARVGLPDAEVVDIKFEAATGADVFWAFILRKGAAIAVP